MGELLQKLLQKPYKLMVLENRYISQCVLDYGFTRKVLVN